MPAESFIVNKKTITKSLHVILRDICGKSIHNAIMFLFPLAFLMKLIKPKWTHIACIFRILLNLVLYLLCTFFMPCVKIQRSRFWYLLSHYMINSNKDE